MKTCKRCGEDKPLSGYHKNKSSKDGHQLYCKPCNNGSAMAWAKRNPSSMKAIHLRHYVNNADARRNSARDAATPESRKKYRDENRDTINRGQRARRARNREKPAAYRLVREAIKAGDLANPDRCEMCESPSVLAHHEDYSKPLDVNWLCRPCHGKVHRNHD